MTIDVGRAGARGFAAVALLLAVLGTASLYVTVHYARQIAANRASATYHALREARQALLGYAAAYPDRVNAAFGPGYLPCPSRDLRGIAAPACAAATASTLGRLPWHTLRTNELRDASGETLWYAVSDSHRYNPKQVPLNSEHDGAIDVDGARAVAVILAPGPALAHQYARPQRSLDPGQFFEALNADANLARFTGAGRPPGFNDRLAVITRRDLMNVVEARVLGEVEARLEEYARRHDGHYPALAPGNPLTTPRRGSPGVRAGWLPFHYADSEAGETMPYASEASLAWDLGASDLEVHDPHGLIASECLQRRPCGGAHGVHWQGRLAALAQCLWWSPTAAIAPNRIARCAIDETVQGGDVIYRYRIAFALLDDDGDLDITPPRAERLRTRRIVSRVAGAPGGDTLGTLTIAVQAFAADGREGRARVAAAATTRGWFDVAGLAYPLDVNAGELPAWFVRDRWHQLIFVAWARADCRVDASCLALRMIDPTQRPTRREDIRALLVSAGPPLPGAPQRTPAADLSAWFEADNAARTGAGAQYLRAPPSAGLNDRVRVIETAP